MPNVPTMEEAGVRPPTLDCASGSRSSGPKGLPEPVKAKLEQAVTTMMTKQSLRERLAKLDITPDFVPGPALHAKLASEIKNWTRFIDAKGIKAGIMRRGTAKCRIAARRCLSTAPPARGRIGLPVNRNRGNTSCCISFAGASIVLRAAGRPAARAGAGHLSRPAGPVRRRLPAGRRDRHVLPADLERACAPRSASSIVIENKGGAGGYIAWQMVAASPTDGYTRAGGGERDRHQPGAVQEASVGLQPAQGL